MEGDSEIYNFFKVWLLVFISLTYCYAIDKITPKASSRFLCILPILCLFLFLPLKLSSVHLAGITSFFIAWLANFKLLLFAFGKNPLSSYPPLSFPRFIATACFPIRIRNPVAENPKKHGRNCKSLLNYSAKVLLLASLIRVYDYGDFLHKKIQLVLYYLHIFVVLDLTLAIIAALIRAAFGFGLELESQFDEPYLSTSLQDFWGRRWNIMVSRILRPTVYEPFFRFCTRAFGRRWDSFPAVFSTFVVSAVMHEVIFYHLGRVGPVRIWRVERIEVIGFVFSKR